MKAIFLLGEVPKTVFFLDILTWWKMTAVENFINYVTQYAKGHPIAVVRHSLAIVSESQFIISIAQK